MKGLSRVGKRGHGGPTARTHPAEYRAWAKMRHACHHPAARGFHLYGGRGVKVCARWKESFRAFVEDLGARPSPAARLVREDRNGDFEPGNCGWRDLAGGKLQAGTALLPVGDRLLPAAAAARAAGLSANTVYKRLRDGVPPEDALAGAGKLKNDKRRRRHP